MLNYKGTVCNNIFNTDFCLMGWVWYGRWHIDVELLLFRNV